jgi:hypothetical protein
MADHTLKSAQLTEMLLGLRTQLLLSYMETAHLFWAVSAISLTFCNYIEINNTPIK